MKRSIPKHFLVAALIGLSPILGACSGGGSSSPSSTPSTNSGGGGTTPTGPTFTQGVFQAASNFKDKCEVVRTGVDLEGNTFPDQAGSTLEENFWLRSWTHETYLWNDEVVDRDPADFDDRLTYFDVLRTTEVTASGEDKDDFHFSQPTEDYLAQRNSAPTASYGVSYVAFSSTSPRDYRIRYTDPDTPASETVNGLVNFPRGARILEVDGVDLVNGTDTDALNAGLFPQTAGEVHTFLIQDVGSNTPRLVTLTSADLARKPVNRTRIISTPTGNVGYILFNTFSPFSSEEEIATAIEDMSAAGVSDLVLDLRYNGGGLLAVAGQLSYMVAGPARTNGKTFELLRFNDDAGNLNPVTGERNDPIPFYSTGVGFSLNSGVQLQSLNLPRVFILSTGRTCSASEAVINGLRGVDVEVIMVGDTTCGKPFGFYPTGNCGETYYTIQFQGVNDKGFGEYSDGFIPNDSTAQFGVRLAGCAVSDDYSNELGEEAEGLLAAALEYRATGSCPAAVSPSTASKTLGTDAKNPKLVAVDVQSVDGVLLEQDMQRRFLDDNRDMSMPN